MRYAAFGAFVGYCAAIALACCTPGPEPADAPSTIGEVCIQVAESACARAATCQPDQAAAYGDCLGDFVSVCCADLCTVASPFQAADVDACAAGYEALSCVLIADTVPAECDRLRGAP